MSIQHSYYKDLYTNNPEVKFTVKNDFDVHVPQEIRDMQNLPITYQEVIQAIQQMANGKTPSTDGLPIEWYKCFWVKIKGIFMELVNDVSKSETLYDSASTGIINLIPKPQKDMRRIKNLRPITLLNSDYKVMEKVIANRMLPAMDHIIHPDQKGFMRHRRISTNTRKILDLIKIANEDALEAMILSLDFEKCFDKIEFQAITGSLDFFGFGEEIKRWMQLLYKNFRVKIQHNGYFSKPFYIKRGAHQGAPASSFYFLVCAEILALHLRRESICREI